MSLKEFIEQHDGIMVILDFYELTPEEGAKIMMDGLVAHIENTEGCNV